MKFLLSIFLILIFLNSPLAQIKDSSDLLFQKGLEEKDKRLYMISFTDLRQALQYNPQNAGAQKELGLVCVELHKYDQAILAFNRLEELKKDDSTAIVNLGILYFWTHQWEKAIAYANKAKGIHAGQHWNYVLGKSYYELEDYGHAFPNLQAASKEDTSNAEIPYLIARAFVDMNNYKPAIGFYQKAISLDSSKVQWIYECALVYATIYDDKSAITYYELAGTKGYKKDNDFYENLSDSYLATGQLDHGLQMMLQVLEKKPADLDLLYSIANTYYRLKKYDQAIDFWDRILYYDKENARSLYMIGMSYQKKGQDEKGRQLCDRAIEMDPSLKNLKQQKRIEM